MDDYLNARMVTTPFGILDCDVPCNAATAVIVSRLDAARYLKRKPIVLEAIGGGCKNRMETWISRTDYPRQAMHDAANAMWRRTDLKPKDVDIAHIYDGFSWLVLSWIEALGFCAEGESGAFVEGGKRIALDGELPMNTNGGQLSEGRMHGLGHLHEAVLQLRREAGARQVQKDVRLSLVANGGGDVGKVVFIAGRDDFVVPGALGGVPLPGIARDSVQGHDAHPVRIFVILRAGHAAFAGGNGLIRVKGEAGDIGGRTDRKPASS